MMSIPNFTSQLTTTLHSVFTISSGGVDLQCHGAFNDQNLVSVAMRRLTAVKIEGNLSVQ